MGILSQAGNKTASFLSSQIGRSGVLGKSALFGAAASWGARNARGYASMSRLGQRAIAGGVLGAGYGAISDNTSILGGAMMGAAIGGMSSGIQRSASSYLEARKIGLNRMVGAKMAANQAINSTRRTFGPTLTRARNGFSGLLNKYRA